MGSLEKIIKKFLSCSSTCTYKEAEQVLLKIGFNLKISSSHHIFRKEGYAKNITLKKRPELLPYQIKFVREVLKDHGY